MYQDETVTIHEPAERKRLFQRTSLTSLGVPTGTNPTSKDMFRMNFTRSSLRDRKIIPIPPSRNEGVQGRY